MGKAEQTDQSSYNFRSRDDFLQMIGYSSYSQYLESDLWSWIRKNLMRQRFAKFCILCGSTTGLQWHHRSYEPNVMVGNFSLEDHCVIRLCGKHHSEIHISNALSDVDKKLLDLLQDEEVKSRLPILIDEKKHRAFMQMRFELESIICPPDTFGAYEEFSTPGGY